jgi:hypothetical protein
MCTSKYLQVNTLNSGNIYREAICKVVDALVVLAQNGDFAPPAWLRVEGKYDSILELCLWMSHDVVFDRALFALRIARIVQKKQVSAGKNRNPRRSAFSKLESKVELNHVISKGSFEASKHLPHIFQTGLGLTTKYCLIGCSKPAGGLKSVRHL